uniref:Uncharacterized protein n=1 Tax=Arion vulgaris TaxID=1028688 RepID=A0A0B7B0U7_9EUPU
MLTMPKKKSKDKKSANIFEKLRTNVRNGITSSSEKNGDVKFETKEYKIQNNLDFDTKINVVNDVNNYNMCESTIVNQQKSEQD